MKNKISEITRQKIADTIELSDVSIEGDLGYHEFLNRLFDLKLRPSYDHRYDNAYSDINCHTHWGDYAAKTWMFNDARFNLIRYSDDVFIKIIKESLHPLVCRAPDFVIAYPENPHQIIVRFSCVVASPSFLT